MNVSQVKNMLQSFLGAPHWEILQIYTVSPGVVSIVIDADVPSQMVVATLRKYAPLGIRWCVVTTYNPLRAPTLTEKGRGLTYWDFLAAGWDDAAMIEYGYLPRG